MLCFVVMICTYDLRDLPEALEGKDARKLFHPHPHYLQVCLLRTSAKIQTMFCEKIYYFRLISSRKFKISHNYFSKCLTLNSINVFRKPLFYDSILKLKSYTKSFDLTKWLRSTSFKKTNCMSYQKSISRSLTILQCINLTKNVCLFARYNFLYVECIII